MSFTEFLYLIGVSLIVWQNIFFFVDHKKEYEEKYPASIIAGITVIGFLIELAVLTTLFMIYEYFTSWLIG